MNYNIKGTGLEITDEIRNYVEKCLSHAEKFLMRDSAARSDIECEYTEIGHGPKYRAEFNLSSSHGLHRAEAHGNTLHEALDIASAELTKEVRQTKKRRLDTFRKGAARAKDYLRGWTNRL